MSTAQLDLRPDLREMDLPGAPTNEERDCYFGPQHRWISMVSFAGAMLVFGSIVLFITHRFWAVWIIVPVLINAVGSVVSLFSSSRKRRYSLDEHNEIVANWYPDYVPSVDFFLPSAGEDLDVINNTLRLCSLVQWHGVLTFQVMDDSARPEVEALAAKYGFTYAVRSNRPYMKKAGNLLSAYGRTGGDFIVVLDADFVPRADILYETLPYFDDESIGIVQTPQYFDVDKRRMTWVQHAAGATQILFYKWIQPSRDRSNASICVGSSGIYRRASLEKSGGFAQVEHSEDVHTGVNMLRVGQLVRYVPIVVTKGLCPDAFDQYVTQQYRWCSGSMSLLLTPKFHQVKMTFMQRLSYWAGFLYYIGTGFNIYFLLIPPLLMGLFAPDAVHPKNYLLVLIAVALRQAIVPIVTMRKANMIQMMRIQMVYSFAHSVAVVDMFRRKTDGWVPTGDKRRSRTAQRIGDLSRRWCIGAQACLWSLLIVRFAQGYADQFYPLAILAFVNFIVTLPIITRKDVPGLTWRL